MSKIDYPITVKYVGKDSPLALRHNKVYKARDCGRGWFAIIDETHEEYAYPPKMFEVIAE